MRRLVLLALTLACLVEPAAALAHPLGNFTVNRYSRVELSGDRVYVLYVLDMAEIPAFQERQRIDDPKLYARRTAARIERRLALTLDGRPIALTPLGPCPRISARRRAHPRRPLAPTASA